MTTTHSGQLRRARLLELLNPVIRQELDRLDIRPGQRVLEIGAGTGEITARLARLVGQHGTVSAVDKDTSYLNPTPVIDVYQRNLDGDELPGGPDSFDLVVARWLHGTLPHPTEVLEQMIARLRPDGWLVLADITDTPPRVFRPAADSHAAPEWPGPSTFGDDAHLIHTVMRQVYRTIASIGRSGTWAPAIDTMLVQTGMVQVCTHTATETWTGGGPGCRLLADAVDQIRSGLITLGLSDAHLDRFLTLMADPGVLLSSYESRTIHARKAI